MRNNPFSLKIFETQKEKLVFMFQEDAEFLALKRQKLKRFIADHPVSHQKLEGLGVSLEELLG